MTTRPQDPSPRAAEPAAERSPGARGGTPAGPLTASFATFEDAVRAREALLQGGFGEDEVVLDTLADEAGPVEGNFLVGNGRPSGERTSRPHLVGGTRIPPYKDNFGATVERGWHLLRVACADGDRVEQARSLLAGLDATLIEERH